MRLDEHRQRHIELHRYLDELLADYLQSEAIPNGKSLSRSSLQDFLTWSHRQTIEPEEPKR